MLNYPMFVVLGLFMMTGGVIFGNEENRRFVEEKLPGYTKRIVVPEEGLSDEEKRYLNAIAKMSEALASTKDVNAIATQIGIDTHEIWGDMTNSYLNINFETNRGLGTSKTTSLIIIQGPLIIEGLRPKAGVFLPPGTMVHQEFWFRITGTNAGTGAGSYVLSVEVHPVDKTRSMICVFHNNGHLKMVFYTNEDFAQVSQQKTWSEDGTFLREETLKEPRSIRIFK